MKERILKNWKTTVMGMLVLVCGAGAIWVPHYKDQFIATATLVGTSSLFASKDN